jgi:hypothetical protein
MDPEPSINALGVLGAVAFSALAWLCVVLFFVM